MRRTGETFQEWHYTSANAVTFLRKYIRPGDSVLDVGTGTGILALKAKEAGAGRVLAVDVMPSAIEDARENCKGTDIEVRVSHLNRDVDETFDITLANLNSPQEWEFVPYAARTMKDDGVLILTWFKELSWLYLEEHFEILERTTGFDYDTFVLRKKEAR